MAPQFDVHTGSDVHLVEHAVGVEVEVAARLPELDVRDVRRVQQFITPLLVQIFPGLFHEAPYARAARVPEAQAAAGLFLDAEQI